MQNDPIVINENYLRQLQAKYASQVDDIDTFYGKVFAYGNVPASHVDITKLFPIRLGGQNFTEAVDLFSQLDTTRTALATRFKGSRAELYTLEYGIKFLLADSDATENLSTLSADQFEYFMPPAGELTMTNISTIEDVLENILGLVLGGPAGQFELATPGNGGGTPNPDKSTLNATFRPENVRGGGKWLIAQTSSLTHTGPWHPEYDKDAVTFYKWADSDGTKAIMRLTVWVGVTNRGNTQGQTQNTTDPTLVTNASANPVVALGSAWELIYKQIPLVSGPGTSFDPDVLEAAREILYGLANHALNISTSLETDINKVNTKTDDFKGSAEAAWFHRVEDADHYLSDIPGQNKRWNTALLAGSQSARDFVTAVQDANARWSQLTPGGTWYNPYRVIAAMFNGSSLAYGDLHDGNSNAWDLGTQYANTNEHNDVSKILVQLTPPAWTNFAPFDAFNVGAWDQFDVHLRSLWADNVVNTFAPVLTAAANLMSVLVDTRNQLTIGDPAPVPPLPMPNNVGMPNGGGGGGGGDNFPNFGDNFPNFGGGFPNFGGSFPNFGNDLNFGGGAGGGGGGSGNPFANLGDPNTLFGGGGGGGGGGNPFANLGDPNTLFSGGGGGGNPFASSGGPDGVVASPTLLASGQLGDPFANGGSPGMFFSGAGNPFANSAGPGNGFLGSNDPLAGSPQALGDLTPAQLNQLDSAGLLDNIPLTPEQAAFLRQNGLGLPTGADPTLGQLTSGQLGALQRAGLLDQTPLTAAERANLGLPGTSEISGLPAGPTTPVATNPFPTTVNGLDLPPVGHTGGGGLTLGDVSQPGAAAHPDIPNLHVGTGGLSSVPGITGSPGGLSHDGLNLGTHGGAGGGTGGLGTGGQGAGGGSGAGGGNHAGDGNGLPGTNGTDGADGDGSGFGGMPYMPGMFGGGGGGQNRQDRDRQRNTWLKEDEKVWGTDPECEPAVIGRRGKPTRVDEDDFPATPDERPGSPEEYRPYRRH